MKRNSLLILFLLSSMVLCGQTLRTRPYNTPLFPEELSSYNPLFPRRPLASILPDTLRAHLSAVTFFRDAEFFLPEAKGYTASGFRLTPSLSYGLNAQAQLRGGLILTGIAGTDYFARVQPLLAIDYQPFPWFQLTMGSLSGALNHGLAEPMFDRERWVYDHNESGLQILTNTNLWHSDTWVNWEHFLQPWTPDQERFSLGSLHDLLIPLSDIHQLCLSAAFLGSHRGGQFSTLDTCIETLFNEQLSLRYLVGKQHRFGAEIPFFFYQNMSPSNERYTPYSEGYAFYPQLHYHYQHLSSSLFTLSLGYYQAHQYLSPRGSYLFQCVSWSDPSFAVPSREMLTAHLQFRHAIGSSFLLSLDAECYHDLDLQTTDFAFGITLLAHLSKKINPR